MVEIPRGAGDVGLGSKRQHLISELLAGDLIQWVLRNIRRPLLAKGTKAADMGKKRSSTVIGHSFSYQPSAIKLFTGLKTVVI